MTSLLCSHSGQSHATLPVPTVSFAWLRPERLQRRLACDLTVVQLLLGNDSIYYTPPPFKKHPFLISTRFERVLRSSPYLRSSPALNTELKLISELYNSTVLKKCQVSSVPKIKSSAARGKLNLYTSKIVLAFWQVYKTAPNTNWYNSVSTCISVPVIQKHCTITLQCFRFIKDTSYEWKQSNSWFHCIYLSCTPLR